MRARQENRQATVYATTLAGVLTWTVALLLNGILKLAEVLGALKFLGVATIAAYAFSSLLHGPLWRWFGTPDFSGRWEGWYWNTLRQKWLPTAHEIKQRALTVEAQSWGPHNQSQSVCASILEDRLGGAPTLVVTYKAEGTNGPASAHTGTHILRLVVADGTRRIEGKYFSDNPRFDGTVGQGGFIRLSWASKQVCNGLAYASNRWALPEPTTPPPSG